MKKCRVVKDRFLFDDYESGLYFDLYPLRKIGNEDAINAAIDEACQDLKRAEDDPGKQLWLPTLFLNDIQLQQIPKRYQQQFACKSRLLLFRAGFKPGDKPVNEWGYLTGYNNNGIVCNCLDSDNKKWIYYTNWSADNLRHRYRVVSKDEVDNYHPAGFLPQSPLSTDDENPVSGDYPVGQYEFIIHMKCPHCGRVIY